MCHSIRLIIFQRNSLIPTSYTFSASNYLLFLLKVQKIYRKTNGYEKDDTSPHLDKVLAHHITLFQLMFFITLQQLERDWTMGPEQQKILKTS